MIKVKCPSTFNGKQFKNELKSAGIKFDDRYDLLQNDGAGNLMIDIDVIYQDKIETIIAKHQGQDEVTETSIEQKLAEVGLDIVELKAALGI